MKLLVLDTSTQVCAIALSEDTQLVADCRLNLKNVHNEKLVGLIEQLTREVHWPIQEISAIGITRGPGSFTGLRIGVSAAKGLAFSLNIPLLSVYTLDVLAQQVSLWSGPVCVLIKAREHKAYAGFYHSESGRVRRNSDFQLLDVTELPNLLKEKTLVVSNPANWFPVDVEKMVPASHEYSLPQPLVLAKLVYDKYQKEEFENLDSFEPFYLLEFQPKKKAYYGIE